MLAAAHLGLSPNTADKMYPHLALRKKKNNKKKKTHPIIAGVRRSGERAAKFFPADDSSANSGVAEFLTARGPTV